MLSERRDQIRLAAARDRSVAWMTAALERQKRLPPYERFVEIVKRQPLTAAEIAKRDADIDALAASSGLVVYRGDGDGSE